MPDADPASALTPSPTKPRPGIAEAVMWCVVFVAVIWVSRFLVAALVLTVHALQAPDASQFFADQFAGFRAAVAPNPPEGGVRPPIPAEFGQALAYGMLAAQFGSLALIVFVVPRRVGPDWRRRLAFRRPAGLHVFLALLLLPGFMLFPIGIQEVVTRVTGMRPPPAIESLNAVFQHVPLVFTFLTVGLGPGILEEVWCRGFLGRGLSARYGLVWGVVLTSVLFAFMHLDPSQFVVLALLGAYLHFTYVASRSIWTPIMIHALSNAIGMLFLVRLDDPSGFLRLIYLASFALLLFASIAMWTGRAVVEPTSRTEEDWLPDDSWKPEYPGVSLPPTEAEARLRYETVSPAAMMLTMGSLGALIFVLSR